MKLWTGQTISQFGDEITGPRDAAAGHRGPRGGAVRDGHPRASSASCRGSCSPCPPACGSTGCAGGRSSSAPTSPAPCCWRRSRSPSSAAGSRSWQVYVVAFLAGTLEVFFDVAYQSYLPSVVERDELVEGNSKLELSRAGSKVAGPTVAGFLIQAIRAPIAILFDAASYLGAALFIGLIRRDEPIRSHTIRRPGSRRACARPRGGRLRGHQPLPAQHRGRARGRQPVRQHQRRGHDPLPRRPER